MKIKLLIFISVLFFSVPAFAELASYKVIKEKSSLKFFAINNNAPVEGEFKDFTADITFNADKPEEGKITVEVNIASVAASYDDVAKTLLTTDWLSAEKFPKAVFTSENISRMPSTDNYFAEGKLQLRDKTLPVVINFEVKFPDSKNAISKGFITLRRTDFGIGQGEWSRDDVVKNEVRVEFRLAAEKL